MDGLRSAVFVLHQVGETVANVTNVTKAPHRKSHNCHNTRTSKMCVSKVHGACASSPHNIVASNCEPKAVVCVA